MQSTIPLAAYKKAANIFSTIASPNCVIILQTLMTAQELSAKQLASTSSLNLSQVHKIIPKLITIGLIRKETMGVEVIYKLVHGRLETINAATARLL